MPTPMRTFTRPPAAGPSNRSTVANSSTGSAAQPGRLVHRVPEGEHVRPPCGCRAPRAAPSRPASSRTDHGGHAPRPGPRSGRPGGCSRRTGRSRRRRPSCSGRASRSTVASRVRSARSTSMTGTSSRCSANPPGPAAAAAATSPAVATAWRSSSRSVTTAHGVRPGRHLGQVLVPRRAGSGRAGPGGRPGPSPRRPARPGGCRRSARTGRCRAAGRRWRRRPARR